MEVKNYFATDTQGNVLGSAQVYLYLAGTTTLATGLQNISGAALANPFVSDANGLVQFKAPDNNYDLRVVKPGREFTIRIQCFDGIAFMSTVVTRLEWQSDTAGNAFFSHETNYPQGTIGSRLGQTVLITDAPFGGIGDGSFDNYNAIQAALDSGAKVIALPPRKGLPGIYKVSRTPKAKFPGQYIIGGGIAATTLLCATGAETGIEFTGPSSCGIGSLKLAGSNNTSGELLKVQDSTGFRASSIRIEAGFNGATFHRVNNCKMTDFVFADMKGDYGVSFSGDETFKSDVLNLVNGEFSHFNNKSIVGIHWKSYAHSMTLEMVRVIRGGTGLKVENSSGVSSGTSYPSFLQMIGCEFDFQDKECLRLDLVRDAWITNLYTHESATADNIYVSSACKGVRFVIPRCASAYKNGIYSEASALEIIGGEFWSNSKSAAGDYDGIRLGSQTKGAKIIGVISGDADNGSASQQGYGIGIHAGAQRVSYFGCGLDGNIKGTVQSQSDLPYEVGGTYRHRFLSGGGAHLEIGGAATAIANQIRIAGAAASSPPQILSQGSDENVDLQLTPKGTGCVRFGSRNTSPDAPITGYITIRDASGVLRKLAVID